MSHQYDEFDDPSFSSGIEKISRAMDMRRPVKGRGRFIALAILIVLAAVFAGVVSYSYPREAAKQELKAVPVIRAAAGPVKVAPNDPGGMEIANRDSTVFDTLRAGAGADRRVESLLSGNGDEQPMDRGELFAGLKTELNVDENNRLNLVVEMPKKAPPSGEKPQDIAPAAGPEAESEDPTPLVRASAIQQPKPTAKPAVATPSSSASGAHYMVQLASLRSQDAAQAEWQSLQKRFPSQLAPLSVRVQKADLGAKGVYYRVQGGPLTETQAQSVCRDLAAQRPGGCLVVKR